MEPPPDRRPERVDQARPAEARANAPAPPADRITPPTHQAAVPAPRPPSTPAPPPAARPPSHFLRNGLLLAGLLALLAGGAYFFVPWLETSLNTVSTDDAYVDGHVTFVAPRVAGQVAEVLVDDNYRVKKGDVLVRLDREPYQVQLTIREAAVKTAEADLKAAEAQVRSQVATAHANRYKLEHAMEDVKTQIANLHAAVATLQSKKATLELDRGNLRRGRELQAKGAIGKEELETRQQTVKVDEAAVEQALQEVYALRAGLGLPSQPAKGDDPKYLKEVPPALDQTFSTVQSSLATLVQSAAQWGYYPTSLDSTPNKALEEFFKQDPSHNLDVIIGKLIPEAPGIKQAKAKLLQAQSDLDQAKLNLRYCDVISEIDGVVTRRSVNPGNNVAVGQNLMAVRSLTEIWIDANFKETQLADLRIGQRVRCEVDMYGSRQEFQGYISGFTMGTGQTLALLPPQNATGNFVKIVQRLPVRIEVLDYNPDQVPLFAGLSVVPYVYCKQPLIEEDPRAVRVLAASTVGLLGSPSGQGPLLAASAVVPGRTDIPGKGQRLQPLASLPTAPPQPRP